MAIRRNINKMYFMREVFMELNEFQHFRPLRLGNAVSKNRIEVAPAVFSDRQRAAGIHSVHGYVKSWPRAGQVWLPWA